MPAEDGAGLSLRVAGAGRCLLEPHQPHQPTGAGLRLRQEGRPGPSRARTAGIATRRRSRPSTASCPRTRSTPRRLRRPERPLPGSERGGRAGGSSTSSSSGSTAWTGRPRRPRRSSRRARSTPKGKGSGLIFQDYDAGGTAQYGFVVTSPTHDKNTPDVDAQTVVIPPDSLGGGYDARIAGPNPWTLGPAGPEGSRLFQGTVGQRGRPGGRAGRRRCPARLYRLVAERRAR